MSTPPLRDKPRISNHTSALEASAKAAYWGVVEDCLVKFHDHPKPSAHGKANAFRKKIENPPPGIAGEIIYHDEPFYLACDLAGIHDSKSKDQIIEKFMCEYREILRTRGW